MKIGQKLGGSEIRRSTSSIYSFYIPSSSSAVCNIPHPASRAHLNPNTPSLSLSIHRHARVFSTKIRPKISPFSNHTILRMKFLEYTPLDSINYFLRHVNLGECTIKGALEAYSCKHTGLDRKLSLSLEHEEQLGSWPCNLNVSSIRIPKIMQYVKRISTKLKSKHLQNMIDSCILDYLGQSPDSDSPSSADYLSSRSSRKTLIFLVLTLSHMYPDYDFSAVQAHNFFREEEWDSFKQMFDTYMFEASKEWAAANDDCSLLESICKAIDEVVKLPECEIYSYNPDSEGDPLLEKGAIWSFNFFFYNRKLKRVIGFRCCCLSNLVVDGFLMDEHNDNDTEGEIFDDMDM